MVQHNSDELDDYAFLGGSSLEGSTIGGSDARVGTMGIGMMEGGSGSIIGGSDIHIGTMGIGTILKARRIILMAFGESKADAVAAAVTGPVTPDCPASFLQRHPDVVFVTDQEAAAKITSQMEET